MRRSYKKNRTVLCIALLLAMCLCACGGKDNDHAAVDALRDKLSKQQEKTDPGKQQTDTQQEDAATSEKTVAIDFDSEEEILAFLDGEWAFLDRETGKDFATIDFHADGSLKFTRLSDEKSSTGRIIFEERYGAQEGMPLQFRLQLNESKDVVPEDVAEYTEDISETSGTFHIGCGADTDYLYLTEIGNGDSMISCYVFNTHPGEAYFDVPTWVNEWMFYRKNHGNGVMEPKKNEELYAWAWKRNDDGSVLLQEMEPRTFDTYEDYTERAYMGAYFAETGDISATEYAVSEHLDTTELYDETGWNEPYPLRIYRVQTDDFGSGVFRG